MTHWFPYQKSHTWAQQEKSLAALACGPIMDDPRTHIKVGKVNKLHKVVCWLPRVIWHTGPHTHTIIIKYKYKKEYTLMSAIKMIFAFYLNICRDEISKISLRRDGLSCQANRSCPKNVINFIWFSMIILCCICISSLQTETQISDGIS